MIPLYSSCSRAKNATSGGSITGAAVQSSVVGVPVWAVASKPNPYGKLTITVSPRGGAQFAATVNGAGANAPLAQRPYQVVPREKNGSTTLLARCPSPTAMRTALAPVASIESSTWAYSVRNAAVSVASVVSPASAAPSRSLLPSQTLTNVGRASIMACVWVRAPSISRVRRFELVPGAGKFSKPSITSAPGTATLVRNGGMFGLRSAQVVLVPPKTRAPVKMFVNGGGHPGGFRLG